MAEDSDDEIAKEARRRVSRHRGPGASSVAPKVEKLLGLRPSSEAQLELLQGEDAALRELEALRCVFCRSYHGRGAWDEPEGAEAEGEGDELCDDCASESSERSPWAGDAGSVEPTWRLRERMKTVSVALVLCLNIGTDPPDAVAARPRARRECWLEPFAGPSRQKALETIGAALQAGAVVEAKKKNDTLYGAALEEILFSGRVAPTAAGAALIATLNQAGVERFYTQ